MYYGIPTEQRGTQVRGEMSVSFLSSSAENSCRPRWASDGLEGGRSSVRRRGETNKGSRSPYLTQNTAGLQYNCTGISYRLQLNESKYFRNFGQKFNTVRCCVVLCSSSAERVSLK